MDHLTQRPWPGRLRNPAPAATGLLVLALLAFLAFSGGGYDVVPRGQAGILVCWLLALGAAVGLLPAAPLSRSARIALCLLAAFVAWTAIALAWTESAERTAGELGKLAMYLAAFALLVSLQAPGRSRAVLDAVAGVVGAVALLAVLSRLHPAWFPPNRAPAFLIGSAPRLSYPVNYWNGLAALVAMGAPALLAVATSARARPIRAAATAALPVLALCVYYTGSRAGVVAGGLGLVAFVAFAPDRLPKVGALALASAGAATLLALASSRGVLRDGLLSAAAREQGDEMLAWTAIVTAAVALAHAGLVTLARGRERPRALVVSPRDATRIALAVAAAVAALALAGVASGELADGWREFKRPGGATALARSGAIARLGSTNGEGRYQYWSAGADAFVAHPLTGIGPGTFELWWARNATRDEFVRDAHSLYAETLAELGVPGLALLMAFLLVVLGAGATRALRAPPPARAVPAAALAGVLAFAAFAALDWVWELAAVAVMALALAALCVAGGDEPAAPSRRSGARLALAALAALALAAIAIPLAAAGALRDSQAEARAGRLDAALDRARGAQRIQPFAATPRLQQALVLEQAGAYGPAARAVAAAAAREPTNWRVWLVRSRIQAERGDAAASRRAYRRARSLNRRSPIFRP